MIRVKTGLVSLRSRFDWVPFVKYDHGFARAAWAWTGSYVTGDMGLPGPGLLGFGVFNPLGRVGPGLDLLTSVRAGLGQV